MRTMKTTSPMKNTKSLNTQMNTLQIAFRKYKKKKISYRKNLLNMDRKSRK